LIFSKTPNDFAISNNKLNTHMRLREFAHLGLGYSTAALRYPYRVKTKNGKIVLVKDPSKGLKK